MGGALAAIEQEYIQNEIHNAAYRHQQAVEAGEEIVVGVNAYQTEEKLELERLRVDPAIEAQARQRIGKPCAANATTPKSADCSPAWPNPPAGTRT